MREKGFAPIIIILGTLLLIGGVGGGYFLVKNPSFLSKQSPVSPEPASYNDDLVNKPSPSKDPTASWNSYENPKSFVAFKFPENYQVQEENTNPLIPDLPIRDLLITNRPKGQQLKDFKDPIINIQVRFRNSTDPESDEIGEYKYVKDLYKYLEDKPPETILHTSKGFVTKNDILFVDSKKGIRYKQSPNYNNSDKLNSGRAIAILDKEKSYLIYIDDKSTPITDNQRFYASVIESILGTFKFNEQILPESSSSPAPSPSANVSSPPSAIPQKNSLEDINKIPWKNFVGPDFTFSYPSSWKISEGDGSDYLVKAYCVDCSDLSVSEFIIKKVPYKTIPEFILSYKGSSDQGYKKILGLDGGAAVFPPKNGNVGYVQYFILSKGYLITIMNLLSKDGKESGLAIPYPDIFSTFKFN